jgi:hypothetical protein
MLSNLQVAFLDCNHLTGSLEGLCLLTSFNEPLIDSDGQELLTSDCGISNATGIILPISCSCCTLCCSDTNTDLCNANTAVASIEGMVELNYTRAFFGMGNATFLDRSILPSDGDP